MHQEYAQHPLGHVLGLWTALTLQRITADGPGEQPRDYGDRHQNQESPAQQRASCFTHVVHVAAVDCRDDQRDDNPGESTAGDDLEQDRRNEVGRRVDGPEVGWADRSLVDQLAAKADHAGNQTDRGDQCRAPGDAGRRAERDPAATAHRPLSPTPELVQFA